MTSDVLQLRPDGVVWREVDGEVVALAMDDSTYLAVNPAGTALWRRLALGATEDDLILTLVDRYGLAREAAARDVDAFVRDIRSRGLLMA